MKEENKKQYSAKQNYGNQDYSMQDVNEQYEKSQEKIRKEIGEDATKYGEFIPSYFAWIGTKEQKDIVEKLENITKND